MPVIRLHKLYCVVLAVLLWSLYFALWINGHQDSYQALTNFGLCVFLYSARQFNVVLFLFLLMFLTLRQWRVLSRTKEKHKIVLIILLSVRTVHGCEVLLSECVYARLSAHLISDFYY